MEERIICIISNFLQYINKTVAKDEIAEIIKSKNNKKKEYILINNIWSLCTGKTHNNEQLVKNLPEEDGKKIINAWNSWIPK